ncbi:MAG: SufE family protein [Pirellulaceae bacterium]
MSIDEICDDFEDLGDPEDQMQYLIELGQSLPGLDAQHKNETNRVQGCQSNVWLIARPDETKPASIQFEADSDAIIVKGIVAVLLAAYSGRTPEEILAYPIDDIFQRLQLTRFLSPMRSNGLHSMVKRIQALAQQALAA